MPSLISSFSFNSLGTKFAPVLEIRGESSWCEVNSILQLSHSKNLKKKKIARGYQNVKNTACLVDNKYLSHMGSFQQYISKRKY